MILVIDNYDSFVYNLARYFVKLGADCVVKRNDEITLNEIEQDLRPTHIVISPGPCSPNKAGVSLAVVSALMSKIPILGVCLGHQAIGQACGGIVEKAVRPTHGKARYIDHDGEGLFQNIPNPCSVGRYHSLIISKRNFPNCLRVTAMSAEGEITGVQHTQYPTYGVQFHPESILSEYGLEMIHNFLMMTDFDASASANARKTEFIYS